MGSTLSIVWPPAMGTPAAVQAAWPPSRMRAMVAGESVATGIATSANAKSGFPPIA